MGLWNWLFGRKSAGGAQVESFAGGRVISFSLDHADRVAAEMGEMHFDCPNCGKCERINNIGKALLKANPAAFDSTTCPSCRHTYDAGPRIKFGNCPGM